MTCRDLAENMAWGCLAQVDSQLGQQMDLMAVGYCQAKGDIIHMEVVFGERN